MSKVVHLIGAGGPAGIGLTRCLKEHYTVTGEDSSEWARLMMECELGYGKSADMVISLPDSQVYRSSFRPSTPQIEICQDKAMTAQILGKLAPKMFWVRDTQGAGGKGAQMQSEYLPGRNFSVEFVYFEGKMLSLFQKRRLSYSVKSVTQGIENRGSSAVSIVTDEKRVNAVAQEALSHLPGVLHGFYGVDLKENEDDEPKVTEINAGRLLTASYAFFSGTGYNLPLVGVKAFLGEEQPVLPDYPLHYGQIRQVGQLPKLILPRETKVWMK